MKQVTIFFFLITTLLAQAQQSKKNIDSKIEKVTVFLQGAQTQRSAKIMLVEGKQELIFINISPSIEKQSIQVKTDDEVPVLSVTYQQNFLNEQQAQEEIKTLEAQKETQLEKIDLLKNLQSVSKQEETMLLKNQQIGGNNGVKTSDLKEAVDFQRIRLTELYQKQMETDRQIRKLTIGLNKINKQLFELNQKADRSTGEIHVIVKPKNAMKSNFEISYLVKQAGWYPTYDIRVKNISSAIKLQQKANIFQSSGEDWSEVKLYLSTGNPNDDGSKPNLIPWHLRYGLSYAAPVGLIQSSAFGTTVTGKITSNIGAAIPYATVMAKGSGTATKSDANGFFTLNMPTGSNTITVSGVGFETNEFTAARNYMNIIMQPSAQTLDEVVVIGYGTQSNEAEYGDLANALQGKVSGLAHKKDVKRQENMNSNLSYQPTTVIYEIKEQYSILNDGKIYTADIDGYEIDARYEYYAVPKISPNAYLTAKITDWQDLNLLPGEANLFFEGSFLGKSYLDMKNVEDTLTLSLGKDNAVMVKRTLMKEYSSKKFLGSNKTASRQYEIIVRNNKQQPINITVEDQLPISTQKEIEIQNKKHDAAKLNDDTQTLTWQLAIESKQENKIKFGYEIKYPKDKTLFID